MQILFVPNQRSQHKHWCLNHLQVITVVTIVALVLPLMIGVGAYYAGAKIDYTLNPFMDSAYRDKVESVLAQQQHDLVAAQNNVDHHLNALGQRVGSLKAQISRINALGLRLTEMAGISSKAFDFGKEPAMGGPAPSVGAGVISEAELVESINKLQTEFSSRATELDIMSALITDRNLHKTQHPAGWPVKGSWISSNFGMRNDPISGKRDFHAGVDIPARKGRSILAVAAGVVKFAGEKRGYGTLVEVNHGNGYITRYAHAEKVLVSAGQRIEKHQRVATVGSSGRSTGPHLHFEVLKNGRTVNPKTYIRNKLG